MAWQIRFSESARRQLLRLDRPVAERIYRFIHDRLASLDNPRSLGRALEGSSYGSYWRYRVGDWRIICRIDDDEIVILVLKIGNRRNIYR